jgi:hypothetical protein
MGSVREPPFCSPVGLLVRSVAPRQIEMICTPHKVGMA